MTKRRVHQNIWGNWNGYEGTRKVKEFGLREMDAKLKSGLKVKKSLT